MFPFSWKPRTWTSSAPTMDPRAQSMLSPMASAGIPLPGRGGFFSSCDPNVHQQVQHSQHRAQSQAQINLLQQQNDLLSQQLAHQVTSQVPSTHQLYQLHPSNLLRPINPCHLLNLRPMWNRHQPLHPRHLHLTLQRWRAGMV